MCDKSSVIFSTKSVLLTNYSQSTYEDINNIKVEKFVLDTKWTSEPRYQCNSCKRVLHEDFGHGWCPYCGVKLQWNII